MARIPRALVTQLRWLPSIDGTEQAHVRHKAQFIHIYLASRLRACQPLTSIEVIKRAHVETDSMGPSNIT